jgi:hypothetical protein
MTSHTSASSLADAALETFELPGAAASQPGVGASTLAKPATDAAGLRSTAAAAVREVMSLAEKAHEGGRTHMELRLPTQDNESLRVHLNWRDGVVHARFVSESAELQRTLSHEWETVAPRYAEKGLRFAEPSFERHGQHSSEQQPGQSAFSSDHQQQQRSRGRSAGADDLPEFALPTAASTGAARAPRQAASPTTPAPSPAPADARGLRVWA